MPPTEPADLAETARFLHEIFPIPRFADDRYLRWWYRENPVGAAVEADLVENGACSGHFAGIPQRLHSTRMTLPAVLLVDVSIAASQRGRGLMAVVHDLCAEEAARRYPDGVIIGVANGPATPTYRKYLQYRILRPLPAFVCPPVWPDLGRYESARADAAYCASRELEDLVRSLDLSPTAGFSQEWSLELLRFRLASPGASYTLHVGDDVVIVTTKVKQSGVPVVVVLKTFRRRAGTRPIANGAIAAACRFHRAPVAVYAGVSAACRVVGMPLPERLKPAPLNFIVRGVRPGSFDVTSFQLDTYEFLDFDAY